MTIPECFSILLFGCHSECYSPVPNTLYHVSFNWQPPLLGNIGKQYTVSHCDVSVQFPLLFTELAEYLCFARSLQKTPSCFAKKKKKPSTKKMYIHHNNLAQFPPPPPNIFTYKLKICKSFLIAPASFCRATTIFLCLR